MPKPVKRNWKDPDCPLDFNKNKSITVLGLDPGTNNFGLSIIKFRPKTQSIKVVGTTFILNPLRELKAFLQDQTAFFQEELREITDEYGPFDFCIAERFQSRGRGGGATIELINVMLGIVLSTVKCDTRVVTAATWKNSFNRSYSLESLYSEIDEYGLTSHQLDATLLAIFRVSQVYGLNGFSFLTETKLDSLINDFVRSKSL